MNWIIFILVAHLLFGLSCAYLAHETKQKAEPWFLFGTLFGGLALIGFMVHTNRKRSSL